MQRTMWIGFGLLVVATSVSLAASCGGEGDAGDTGEAPWLGEPGDGVLRTATVQIDGFANELVIEDFDGTFVLEDDMVLDPRDVTLHDEERDDGEGRPAIDGTVAEDSHALAAVSARRQWPDGVVYYKFSSDLPQYMRDRVQRAMDAWERKTVIRFERAEAGRNDYVLIVPFSRPFCRASIGYSGRRTYMWLNDVCSVGIIKHEIGHTLGLRHEQSRQDRNEHVRIVWENIKDGFKSNFQRYRFGRDVGPYNIDSIMQYSSRAFSKNGRPTIVRRSDGEPFGGYRTRIHDLDARGINEMYAP